MRLSLYILVDWLKEYNPTCSIAMGERTIRNVRMFSDGHRFLDNNVYISRTGEDSGWVICMHKNDYILLQTKDENQVMNDIMDAFDYYNDWSDGLNRELRSLSLQQILERSADVIDSAMLLEDASYYILAHSGVNTSAIDDTAFQSVLHYGIMDIKYILKIEQDVKIREYRRNSYILDTDEFSVDPSVRNLFIGRSHFGWLISVSYSQSRGKMDVQDELGDILEQWVILNQENQGKWEQKGVFLSILDGTYASRDGIYHRLRLLGWNPEEPKWVYAFTNLEQSLAMIHKVEQLSPNVQAMIYQERLLAFFHGSNLERQQFEQKLEHLLSQSGCRCGISPGFTDMFSLKEQARLAEAATAYSQHLLCPFRECALEYGLDQMRQQETTWFHHPGLKLLREYDAQNRTELYETFYQFLRWERSYARTSREMYLHRNTLLYRVKRIQELTGLDLEDPQLRLHLLISFALGRTSFRLT